MKVCFGYGRASTQKQIKTLEVQEEECAKAFHDRYASTHTYGGFFKEEAQHGDTPFMNRPVATELAKRLEGGDVVICTMVDRPFRDLADCVQVLAGWFCRSIVLFAIEIGCDTSTATNLMVVHIRASVAQFELHLIRKRTLDVMRHLKKTRGFSNQHPGYGWKIAGPPGKRHRIPDEHERAQVALIVHMHDVMHMSLREIYWHFFRTRQRVRNGKLWGLTRIWRAYDQYRRLKEANGEPT